jgi:DNA gyrase inhibitor GyrI
MVGEQVIQVRDDFFIENYANDPRTTPEAELITQILIPTA